MFGKRAAELLREVIDVLPEHLPAYNDEGVRLVLDEVEHHNTTMLATINGVHEREADGNAAEEDGGRPAVDWSKYPEEASAIIVHHDSILRNKRVLWTYMKLRFDAIRELRWHGRALPPELKTQLSPLEQQYFKSYDKLLTKYMSKGEDGVGMDLTLDQTPPKDPSIEVRVLKDYGEVFLTLGRANLKKGTVHLLPRTEAEPLIREGVLESVAHDVHLS